jgi:hypothetical protein
MTAAAHGSLKVHDDGEDYSVDAFSKKELAQRPEVRFINRYAVLLTYVLMGLRGMGGLELLWASVVLLGGFVSALNKKDFWYITFIALVQAAGLVVISSSSSLSLSSRTHPRSRRLLVFLFFSLEKPSPILILVLQSPAGGFEIKTINTARLKNYIHIFLFFCLLFVTKAYKAPFVWILSTSAPMTCVL